MSTITDHRQGPLGGQLYEQTLQLEPGMPRVGERAHEELTHILSDMRALARHLGHRLGLPVITREDTDDWIVYRISTEGFAQ